MPSETNMPSSVRRRLPFLSSNVPFLRNGAALFRQKSRIFSPNLVRRRLSEMPFAVRSDVITNSLYLSASVKTSVSHGNSPLASASM